MPNFGNTQEILKRCRKQKNALWPTIERLRPELLDIAKAIYPPAITGLTEEPNQYDENKAREFEDDKHRLTAIAAEAFRIGASGFHVNLTSPARKWFSLTIPEFGSEVNGDKSRQTIERLTEATRWLIGWSGGYKALGKLYKHLLAFGFGTILAQPDQNRYIRTECLRIGTYALGIDNTGKPDRLVRKYAFTAEQLIDEFGKDVVSDSIIRQAESGEVKKHTVWCLIEPHHPLITGKEDADWKLPYDDFEYRSIYWMDGQGVAPLRGLLAVRGFARKPFVSARLEYEEGDTYGRGRGALALGMCHGFQQLCEDRLDISGMAAQPAVVVSSDLEGNLQLGRGGINYVARGDQSNEAVRRALAEPPNAGELGDELERLRSEIQSLFYNGEFASISAIKERPGVKTATEVGQIVRENMEQLSALVTTLDDELLDPIVTLYFNRTIDAGLVDIPEELLDQPLNIKYESNIHRAQQAADVNARNSSMSFSLQIAQVKPDVLDNFNFDRLVREMHRDLGGSEQDLITEKDIAVTRQARAQEEARQQKLIEDQQQATTMKEFASTPVSDQSLGGKLMGALAGNEAQQ